MFILELKRDHGEPTKLQLKEIITLRSLGFDAGIVYGKGGVDQFILDALGARHD